METKVGRGYKEVIVEYRVKFGTGFDFVRGGKLPGLIGGTGNTGNKKPTGTDGWSARIHWRTGGSNGSLWDTSKANVAQYLYHVDQPKNSGEDFRWIDAADSKRCEFESNRWYHIKQRVILNSPQMKDGVVQVWLDEQQVLDLNNVRFRTNAELKIDQFYFSTFFGGSGKKWQASKHELAYFDDFKIYAVLPSEPKK